MKEIIFRITYFSLLIIILSSCVTARKVNYMQKPGMNIPTYKDSISFEEYRLKVDDRLYIKVYSLDDKMNALVNGSSSNMMSSMQSGTGSFTELYTYLIDDDGNITLPHMGKMHVEGKTLREAKIYLEEEFAPYFRLEKVDVDVRVVGRYYSIIGQSASGRFPLSRDKINIFQALAQAGDIGAYGNKSKIRILRETPDGTQIKEFDVRSADIIHSEFYYVEPNDVIYIQNRTDQIFGITHFTGVIGLIMTTASFVLFIRSLVLSFE